MTDDVRDPLRGVWDRRRASVLARADVIAATLAAARDGTLGEEQRRAGMRQAHMLSGSAGTFGFMAAGRMARELEGALAAPGGPPRADLDRLAEMAAALRRELEGEPETMISETGLELGGEPER